MEATCNYVNAETYAYKDHYLECLWMEIDSKKGVRSADAEILSRYYVSPGDKNTKK